jgi:DNA adenine methylase
MAYPGGKNGSGVYQKIINQIPPHRVFISAFLGHCAIMRYKLPAKINIGIDQDQAVVDWWNPIAKSNDAPGGYTIINGDAISFLETYAWQGDEFLYCDPPYLFDVRSCKRDIYTAEFGDMDQHERLLSLLKTIPCNVALSGYKSELYEKTLSDWRTINFQTVARSGQLKTEWVWMNYAEPSALHDYRYLGDNFRERERLTRIRKRWQARILRMDQLERYMLTAAIAELGDAGQHRNK